ncbi:MAG: dacA [Rhodospirillales bacterium]|nr:dacA [Rhodospirillales bacterium]
MQLGGRIAAWAIGALLAASSGVAHATDASIVIDADSNQVISQEDPDRSLHPASMTKMMTLLMTFDAIESGKLSLQKRLPVSSAASSMSPTKIGVQPGDTLRVEDGILALVTQSANDAAVVLAEGIGGTEQHFAQMMTARARQLGMRNTIFRNASGLPDPGQISTARDMAVLARTLIKQYTKYYSYFSTEEFEFNGSTYRNHNHLMERYAGMDGLKTGFIRASGFNLTASAVRNGHRLIGVVFGGPSAVARDNYMAALLDAGFRKAGQGDAALVAAAGVPKPGHKPLSVAIAQYQPEEEPAGEQLAALADAATKGEGDIPFPAPTPKVMAPPTPVMQAASMKPAAAATASAKGWGIQVGAFSSTKAAEAALDKAVRQAPALLAKAQRAVEALKSGGATVYRARLVGLDPAAAKRACSVVANCLKVAPGA